MSARPQVTSAPEKFRGVNNRLAPENLEPGWLHHAQNYRTRSGDLVPRRGTVKPGWLNVTHATVDQADIGVHPVDAYYGVAVFKDPNGVEWAIKCSDGGVFRCRPNNERYPLPLPDGTKILGPCFPVQAFNKVWLFRGRYLAPLVIRDLETGVEDILPHYSASATYALDDEIAYGPWREVSTVIDLDPGDLTSSSTTATVTHVGHGLTDGDSVLISGATQTEYNGVYTIHYISSSQFSYTFAGSAITPATGTIKVQLANLTSAGDLATVRTVLEHGYVTGADITIRGAAQTEYNGRFNITVVDAFTFTFRFAGSATSPATGDIQCSNMGWYWTEINEAGTSAGESPDSAPAKWNRAYDILPNADDAVYVNNRLLVPTAYTPGDSGYDSTSSYTKKDFIVATDMLDDIHFDFANEFRINQGSDDEIVCLVKYNQDTVIVCKDRSWGILSNIRYDLSQLTLDMRNDGYGACARAIVVAGKDVFFPALKRGLVSVAQNELGKVTSVDVPFSDDIEGYVNRINWSLSRQQRLGYWGDCLYWAVALDDGICRQTPVPTTGAAGSRIYDVTVGRTYEWTGGDPGNTVLSNGTEEYRTPTRFVAQAALLRVRGVTAIPDNFGAVRRIIAGNNALLVYDFRTKAWAGVDVGDPFCVQEFFYPTYCGQQRLASIGNDGWTNILEEALSGDQIEDVSAAGGLGWAEIETDAWGRGLTFDTDAPKQFKRLAVVLQIWNARFSLTANTGAAHQVQPIRTGVSFSRTKYLKPFDKAPYVAGNANGDHATRGRGDYSVPLPAGGLLLGDGLVTTQEQEITVRASVRTLAHRYVQLRCTNDRGRCTIMALGTDAAEGQHRDNIIL